jgi:hypothetical protein
MNLKNKNFDIKKFIKNLIKFSPRQGKNEQKTAKFIASVLKDHQIPFVFQNFKTSIPNFKKVSINAGGKHLKGSGASFVSGKIIGKENIISSLIFSDNCDNIPNFNFNPKSNYISRPTFYQAPAIAIDKKILKKILEAEKVIGEVKVEPFYFTSSNIIVGNLINPKTIVFAHYDSLETGATDNASGVAVVMNNIISNPTILKSNLFVFSGNEELSYDKPFYWGRGYRIFEKKYKKIMGRCHKIIIVDSLGNGPTIFDQNKELMHLAFPIVNMEKWSKKTFLLYGDMEKLMKVYHTTYDNIKELNNKNLKEASLLLAKEIS